jgi:hypothetical protein
LIAPAVEEGVRADDERSGAQLAQFRERGVELAFGACVHDVDLLTDGATRVLHTG